MEKEKEEEEKDEILVDKEEKENKNKNEKMNEKEKKNGTKEKNKGKCKGKSKKDGNKGEDSRKNWIEEAREAKSYLLNKVRTKGNEMHELVMCFDCEAFEKGDYKPTKEKLQQYMQSWSKEDRLSKVKKDIGYIPFVAAAWGTRI